MSTYNPPTLEQLALEVMVRNDAIDFSDVEYLPTMLFPPLFLEAFNRRRTELLKATVAAWPFSYLPVGPLLKSADLVMMQAVLGGIDLLMTQNVPPRRKLQVLDFRDVHQDFWDAWARREDGARSPDTLRKKQGPGIHFTYALPQGLQMFTILGFHSLNKAQKWLFRKTQKKNDSSDIIYKKNQRIRFPYGLSHESRSTLEGTDSSTIFLGRMAL
uniref:PRAME family member 6-like n=1 Tax=Arvicanthis niloticus TaxID=61156 RepID=UPI0014862EC5|nr:PRAME family member 6-like [Arvicanthis niloticus]